MRRARRASRASTVLLSLGLALVGCSDAHGGPFPAAGTAAVLSVPDASWSVSSLDGRPVSLASLRGRVVFLNVWATWCPPCVKEMPSIAALADVFAGRDVAFVVASAEDPVTIERFAEAHGYRMPFHHLDRALPAGLDGGGVVPVTFVLDRQGRLVFRHVGFRDWSAPDSVAFLRGLLDA
ncbi:MAG: TlpA family protein disulfide reductase [Planctomycetes bacterium]|nr:TlpA family protein disulfide reductase [Planctomycetota bacterium]